MQTFKYSFRKINCNLVIPFHVHNFHTKSGLKLPLVYICFEQEKCRKFEKLAYFQNFGANNFKIVLS